MKRISISLMLLLCFAITAMAVPAKPGWHIIHQSDGTTLKVRAAGNAFNSAILTSDGLTVARGSDGDFYYTSSLTGLTAVRAHEADQRSAAENAFIDAQRGHLTMQSRQMRKTHSGDTFRVGGSNEESGVPAQGKRRIPIILAEFKDKKFTNTREEIIEAMLTGNESVGQYFRDQSNGLYEPKFDVYGIYTLSKNREYYGGHSGSDNDRALGAFVTEAVQMAAADGVTFNTYDTNNDDYCDVVIVIYAGVGEAQAYWNHPEAIWPCNWDLGSAYYYGMGGSGPFRPNYGDPYVNTFAVFNELYGSNDNGYTVDGIGTFTHEFGHCLGLPDFYDTGDSDHYGMGDWDIMCMGCYNNDGFTPPGYTAYEKHFMGWIEYITPHPGTYYTLPVFNQKQAETDKALCITSDVNPNEYFIIENHRRQGWDRYAPGDGIMITHVTYDPNRWWSNSPNNEDIQLMTLMNADNSWSYYDEFYDLWPQGDNRDFTDTSVPAARLNMRANGTITGNAGYLGKPVTEMEINADGTASFWYMKGSATNPVISVSTDNLDLGDVMMTQSGTGTFKVRGGALTGNVALALNDPNGVFSINPTVISASDAANGIYVTVTFSPDAIQDYSATVTLSSPGAQDVVVTLTGHGLIEGYAPVMLPANEQFINLTQFRADWTDQTPAQNVASYTLEVMTKPMVELLETADFSDVPDALTPDGQSLEDISDNYADYLPAGWTCTPSVFAYEGALLAGYDGTINSPLYDLVGYDKVTVVLTACSYYQSYYGDATATVKTSMGSQPLTLGADYEVFTIVLDCAANDRITIQSGENFAEIKRIEIYAGDLSQIKFNTTKTDNTTYRLISDITDRFYTVKDLEAGGTFVYKVKTLFSDGTESDWSNRQEVTLFQNGHGFEPGDVNHDELINLADLTTLINSLLLGNMDGICEICADVNGDNSVNLADMSQLITILLTSN